MRASRQPRALPPWFGARTRKTAQLLLSRVVWTVTEFLWEKVSMFALSSISVSRVCNSRSVFAWSPVAMSVPGGLECLECLECLVICTFSCVCTESTYAVSVGNLRHAHTHTHTHMHPCTHGWSMCLFVCTYGLSLSLSLSLPFHVSAPPSLASPVLICLCHCFCLSLSLSLALSR